MARIVGVDIPNDKPVAFSLTFSAIWTSCGSSRKSFPTKNSGS